MEEDTNKSGTIVPKSDGDNGETKKMPIKFANNPKVLNMCQLSQDSALRALPKSPHTFTSSTVSNVLPSSMSQTSKNITVTSSLLKKLPGTISVSTQRVSIQSQQPVTTSTLSSVSLIPNKPVVVQPINSPVSASPASSSSTVCVSTARKIVFNPGDSRFLKIVNATPESSSISAGKKVIVQRVEQIQPPHAKNLVQGGSSPMKQNKIIVVGGTKPQSKIIVTGTGQPTIKMREESYIVNEMPPEMRTKAIVVSSNNPTGDTQGGPKIIRIPVKSGGKPEMFQNKLDPAKISTPLTITKKFLPIKPKVSVASDKLPTTQFCAASLPGTTFQCKKSCLQVMHLI